MPVLLVLGIVVWCTQAKNQALADPPREDDIAVEIAQETTDSLINELLAAVIDITSRTTPETVLPSSQAISLLLPECQKGYRLLDGTGEPIDRRNRPTGKFERQALKRALDGETRQIERGGKLLTVVRLPFAAANCALCHSNYFDFEPGAIVGAISLQIPLLHED